MPTYQDIVRELRAGPLSGSPVFEEAADKIEELVDQVKGATRRAELAERKLRELDDYVAGCMV